MLLAALLVAAPLTVDEAVQRAIAHSYAVAAAHAREDAARASASAQRSRMLFGVHVSEEQQHYDSPFVIAIVEGAPGVAVRNINTNTLAVGAQQPLLGLLHLNADREALSSRADAAAQSVSAAEREVKEQVQNGFLRLFEARALRDTARSSQEQLAEQVKVAEVKLHAGAGTTADILRVQVALANARQQELQAVAQEEIARAGLDVALGLSPGDPQEFAEPSALETDVAAPGELDAATEMKSAGELRPEVAAARLSSQAAHQHARAALWEMLPEINLEGGYAHVHGSLFAPENSAFVGVLVNWNIFEWGASESARRAASSEAAAAEAELQATHDRVGLEVSARISQVRAAAGAVELGKAAIASAEEAFRVTQAGLKAGVNTTTDLLDAQSALTQSRLNLVRARYELAMARVSLRSAAGK